MTRSARGGTPAATGRAATGLGAPNGGLYLLLVRVPRELGLSLGSLGDRRLPPGWYVYTGSARRGLAARVQRHLEPEKKVRWHIDHLTVHPGATTVGAVLLPLQDGQRRSERERGAMVPLDDSAVSAECALNQAIGLLLRADTPVPRFGAGDCRGGCPAHLWRRGTRLSVDGLAQTASAAGLEGAMIVRSR